MKRCISCLLTAVLFWGLFLVTPIGAEATPTQMQVYYQNPLAAKGVDLKRDRVQMSYSSTQLLVAQHVYSAANPSLEVWSFTLGGKEVTPEKFVELWIKAANSPDCDAGCSFSMSGNWNGDSSSGWKAFWKENMPAKTQSKISYDRIIWSPVSNAEGYRIEYIEGDHLCTLLITLDKGVTSLSLDQIMEELGKRGIKMPADGKIQLQIYAINKAGVIKNSAAVFTVDLSSKLFTSGDYTIVDENAQPSEVWTTENGKQMPISKNEILYNGDGFGDVGYRNHTGWDIWCDVGTPIYAVESGTVIFANSTNEKSSAGLYVEIKDSDGYTSRYLHCSEIVVTSGWVEKGTLIGYSGKTGDSGGVPHLCFQVRTPKNEFTDSKKYLGITDEELTKEGIKHY